MIGVLEALDRNTLFELDRLLATLSDLLIAQRRAIATADVEALQKATEEQLSLLRAIDERAQWNRMHDLTGMSGRIAPRWRRGR